MLDYASLRLPSLAFVLLLSLTAAGAAVAQSENVGASRHVEIGRLQSAPQIDGVIDEAWSGITPIDTHFTEIEPEFGAASPFRTVVRIAQTDSAIYVVFEAFDPQPDRLGAARTLRDDRLEADDSVAILFDTFNDDRTAYFFRTNALAVQEDEVMLGGLEVVVENGFA